MKTYNPLERKSAPSLPAGTRGTENVYTSTITASTAPAQAASAEGEPPAYDGPPWPAPLDAAAFHGLAGEIVRRIEPHTEADSAALLVQFLLAFGNAAGRAGYWLAEDTRHFTNENAVIVGQSSIARKGTSLDRILAFFKLADEHWAKHKVGNGLVSGEGLIHAIRDARFDAEGPEGKCEDEGVTDKRLFVAEGEFAQVLAAAGRKDNTLSVVIRHGWDGKTLRTLAKNGGKGGDTATAPHVSIAAHVTVDELKAKLAAHDAANGFANRFLWVCSRRSKQLPFGGSLRAEDCQDLTARLHSALAHAGERKEVGFTPAAAELWAGEYAGLNQERPGTLGSVTSRAPAHVRRLALKYALLDKADAVDTAHLRAALALWAYCFASAEFIFGGLGGTAREVHERLRAAYPGELNRTDLFNATGRHARADELTRALAELLRYGMAASRKENTGGAPRELWRAVAN